MIDERKFTPYKLFIEFERKGDWATKGHRLQLAWEIPRVMPEARSFDFDSVVVDGDKGKYDEEAKACKAQRLKMEKLFKSG